MTMPNLSFTLGSFAITPFFWSLILAAILASFSFWRRLKEDSPENQIFNRTLFSLGSALFSGWLFFAAGHAGKFGFSLVGAVFGALSAVVWSVKRGKGNLWETLDALTLPFLYFLIFGGLGFFLTRPDWRNLSSCLVGVLGWLVYRPLKKKYRSFGWYKSGKTGFMISFFGSWVSLVFLVLAFFENDRLYLYRLSWLSLILISVIILYYRSERNLKEDLGGLFKKEKK